MSLESWNDGKVKQGILAFVKRVVAEIPKEDRIATFDNDGCLWVEQPMYTQIVFALQDRAATRNKEEIERELSHSRLVNMPVEEFMAKAKEWLATAKHPRYDRLYTDLVYKPQLELLEYLRENGFKTYIVSGGGQDFVRAFAWEKYGIPTEQVIGSMLGASYVTDDIGVVPYITKEPKLLLNDDKAGKPVGIHMGIGRRPILAVGNSTGDQEMIEYTLAGKGPRLGVLIFHDDAEREYAYGPAQGLDDSHVGAFQQETYDKASSTRNWLIASMKKDWKTLFSF